MREITEAQITITGNSSITGFCYFSAKGYYDDFQTSGLPAIRLIFDKTDDNILLLTTNNLYRLKIEDEQETRYLNSCEFFQHVTSDKWHEFRFYKQRPAIEVQEPFSWKEEGF